MKQDRINQPLNLGDTSFRRKDYGAVLPLCVRTLEAMGIDGVNKVWDTESQAAYYCKLRTLGEFTGRDGEDDPAKRGRTNTNLLVKLGLSNAERIVSPVGHAWQADEQSESDTGIALPDFLESVLGIRADNLVYSRQLLKLRLFAPDGKHYLYPFRYVLRVLAGVQSLPSQIFSELLFAAIPGMSDTVLEKLIHLAREYHPGVDEEALIERIAAIREEALTNNQDSELLSADIVRQLFISQEFSADHLCNTSEEFQQQFRAAFPNRKSTASVESYFQFVKALKGFRANPSADTLEQLHAATKLKANGIFKRAGRLEFPRGRNKDLRAFLEKNKGSVYLQDDDYLMYQAFQRAKQSALEQEYYDMNMRIMGLTGLLWSRQGQVGVRLPEFFETLFETIPVSLGGCGDIESYEGHMGSVWYQNTTFCQILEVGKETELAFRSLLSQRFSVAPEKLQEQLEEKRVSDFKRFIEEQFPVAEVEDILQQIALHGSHDASAAKAADEAVQQKVTDATDIPTIFEYILNIAWYYLSGETTDPLHSMNLSCDGNMLPLSHASGGQGDIEVRQDSTTTVLLEATLMNPSAQKRGEMEPVLRHSVNLAIERRERSEDERVLTLFCANEVDTNVANVFRAASVMELYHSESRKSVPMTGVCIFSLTIAELIQLLEAGVSAKEILEQMSDGYEADRRTPFPWKWGTWRQDRVRSLLAKA